MTPHLHKVTHIPSIIVSSITQIKRKSFHHKWYRITDRYVLIIVMCQVHAGARKKKSELNQFKTASNSRSLWLWIICADTSRKLAHFLPLRSGGTCAEKLSFWSLTYARLLLIICQNHLCVPLHTVSLQEWCKRQGTYFCSLPNSYHPSHHATWQCSYSISSRALNIAPNSFRGLW
jgi:hypothetical protein